jgi:hypothetical protein
MPDQNRVATGASATATAPQRARTQQEPRCRCGVPMHPDHLEKHRGQRAERYTCPRRRWWNFFLHPHGWMEPRDPKTHGHQHHTA